MKTPLPCAAGPTTLILPSGSAPSASMQQPSLAPLTNIPSSSGGMAAAGCAPPVTHLMAFDDTAFEELTAVCNCPQQQFSRSKPCQVSSCHASRSVKVSTSERLPLFLNDGCLARCAAGFVLPHQRSPASPQHQSQFGAQLPSSTHMMAGQEPGQSGPQPLTQMGHSPLIKQEQASAPLMNPSAPLLQPQ